MFLWESIDLFLRWNRLNLRNIRESPSIGLIPIHLEPKRQLMLAPSIVIHQSIRWFFCCNRWKAPAFQRCSHGRFSAFQFSFHYRLLSRHNIPCWYRQLRSSRHTAVWISSCQIDIASFRNRRYRTTKKMHRFNFFSGNLCGWNR